MSKLIREHHSRAGFTLIELLVAISIITIVSSVILVSLQGARTAAYDATQLEAAHQLRTAIMSYYFDRRAYPPIPYWDDTYGNVSVGIPTDDTVDNFATQLIPQLLAGNYISASLASSFYRTSNPMFDAFMYIHACDAQTPCNGGSVVVQNQFTNLTSTCESVPVAAFAYTLKKDPLNYKLLCFYK